MCIRDRALAVLGVPGDWAHLELVVLHDVAGRPDVAVIYHGSHSLAGGAGQRPALPRWRCATQRLPLPPLALVQRLAEPIGWLPGHLVHNGQPPDALVIALDLSQPALASGVVGQDREYPKWASSVQPGVEHSPRGALAGQERTHKVTSTATFNGIASRRSLPHGVAGREDLS